MYINQRKFRKKGSIFRKLFIVVFFIGLFCFAVGGAYLYHIASGFTKANYISPLSQKFSLNQADKKEKNIEEIEKFLRENHIEFAEIAASSSAYTVTTKDGGYVILSSQKDLRAQLSSLQFILSRLTMEGKLFARLDLRFEKPVLVFK